MRQRLAKLTSDILNPFLVSFIIIILLALESTPRPIDALKWALVSLALSVLPVFTVVIYLVRRRMIDGIFVNTRQQRTGIYGLASALGAIGCGVLWYFGAPRVLLSAFTAGLSAMVVFMVINLFWKISLHTAFMAASVTILTIVYGAAGALAILLLALVAWARLERKMHSPWQVAAGALLAAGIVAGVFRCFGIIG